MAKAKRTQLVLAGCLLLHAGSGLAQTTTEQPATSESSRAADQAEEKDIAAELAQMRAQEQAPAPSEAGRPDTASALGLSRSFNPAISATGSVLGGGSNRRRGLAGSDSEDANHLRSGLTLQEVELRMSAVVDPYLRADITLAGNGEGVAFEEAYLTTTSLPRINIRAGQMIANLGRHNLLHTHAFPFLTAPLPWRALLGAEGLRDVGVSADILLPLPFFAEINAQVFAGQWPFLAGGTTDDPSTPVNEFVPDARDDEDLAYMGHLKTLFDLSDSSTAEVGATAALGRNGFGGFSKVLAGDLTITWRPVDAERYTSLQWSTEYLYVGRDHAPEDSKLGGVYSALRYQFAQRYWVQARGAVLGVPVGAGGRTVRAEALFALVPSEFSALRLQYAFETDGSARATHELFVQAIISIGAHPAHAY